VCTKPGGLRCQMIFSPVRLDVFSDNQCTQKVGSGVFQEWICLEL